MTLIFESVLRFLEEVGYQLHTAPDPFYAALVLFVNGLWIPTVIIMLGAAKVAWMEWRMGVHHMATRNFILLAIDVPRLNEQSPKAVENIFTQLHGAL
ncbi:MAG: hypothetical protein U1C18_00370, partial [Patescibacteria group bacterium]|nr:hypothetical protein [Patescibacteria group bacterium]